METIDDLLAQHPFFRGLSPEDRKFLAGCASNVHFDAGQYLFREGEEAERFYAIRAGSVAVEIQVPERGPVMVHTVGPGEILGWSWLFPPYRYQLDARAREAVRATVFDGACVRQKCETNPALGYEMMKRVAHLVSERLDATRVQLLDLYGPSNR
jgi:CRP-like cAMP-binding protein